MKNNLSSLRKGNEFINYALSRGATVRQGKGSHVIVKTERGSCVVPVHPGELGKGLRIRIIKIFTAIGLAAFAITLFGLFGGLCLNQ